MKRRRLLVGLGGLAGASSVLASGAFTSISANRNVSVAVADDTDALLAMRPCDGPNGEYVTTSGGLLTLDVSPDNPTSEGGQGVNPDATTVMDDVFEVVNQGTQPVGVWLDVDPVQNGNGNDAVALYQDGDQSLPIVGEENAVCLGVGEKVCVGLVTRTQGIDSDHHANLLRDVADGHEMVVHADADAACSAPLTGQPRRLSTGVADWEVAELPPGVSPPAGESIPYDAKVVENPPSAWVASNADAEWVDPFDTGGLQDDPADSDDPYGYELTFEVSAGSRDLVIEEYAADNPVRLFLDGANIGGTSDDEAYETLRSDVPTQSVAAGAHTLRAEVINEPNSSNNPTGLLVAARLE